MNSNSSLCLHCGHADDRSADRCSRCGESLLLRGRYRVLSRLGQQGAVEIYHLIEEASGQSFRLHLLDETRAKDRHEVDRFDAQGRLLRRLEHPAILRVHDDFQITLKGSWRKGLLLESIEGETLAERIARQQRLNENQAQALLQAILEPLAYLHDQFPPVIHGNINPASILIAKSGSPLLKDFDTTLDTLLSIGPADTPEQPASPYKAPEQLQGRAVPASDLYALGLTLVAGLAGRDVSQLPWSGNQLDLNRAVALSPSLSAVLERMVATDLTERFRSVAEAVQAVAAPAGSTPPALPGADSAHRYLNRGAGLSDHPRQTEATDDLHFGLELDWPQSSSTLRADDTSSAKGQVESPPIELSAEDLLMISPKELFLEQSPKAAPEREAPSQVDIAPPLPRIDPAERKARPQHLREKEAPRARTTAASQRPELKISRASVPLSSQPIVTDQGVRLTRETGPVDAGQVQMGRTLAQRVQQAMEEAETDVAPRRRTGCALPVMVVLVSMFLLIMGGSIVLYFSQSEKGTSEPSATTAAAITSSARSWFPTAEELENTAAIWASQVDEYSSQFSPSFGAAIQALGRPDVYPRYGDDMGAWAPSVPDAGQEWIVVGFVPDALARAILIVETCNPDALVRIEDMTDPHQPQVLWQNFQRHKSSPTSRVIQVDLPSPLYITRLKVVLDTTRSPGSNHIDAIGLIP
ncbi:MAG: hypothetical protein JW797_02395 [Bradymonadales bacterium]|nr:hypothetical protein [Bradymonadales bacterium]